MIPYYTDSPKRKIKFDPKYRDKVIKDNELDPDDLPEEITEEIDRFSFVNKEGKKVITPKPDLGNGRFMDLYTPYEAEILTMCDGDERGILTAGDKVHAMFLPDGRIVLGEFGPPPEKNCAGEGKCSCGKQKCEEGKGKEDEQPFKFFSDELELGQDFIVKGILK